jgi:hypothetical protein
MSLDVLQHRKRAAQRDPTPDDLFGYRQERWARHFEPTLAGRHEDAEPLGLRENLRRLLRAHAEAPAELLDRQRLAPLDARGRAQGLAEPP